MQHTDASEERAPGAEFIRPGSDQEIHVLNDNHHSEERHDTESDDAVFSLHPNLSSNISSSSLSTASKSSSVSPKSAGITSKKSSKKTAIATAIATATASTSNSNVSAPSNSRASHNVVEKKYRANINTKFLQLKDAVPTLRVLDNDAAINYYELDGLVPASRLNKASILSKSTEYIKHLELKNSFLINELNMLKSQIYYQQQQQQQQQQFLHQQQLQQQYQHSVTAIPVHKPVSAPLPQHFPQTRHQFNHQDRHQQQHDVSQQYEYEYQEQQHQQQQQQQSTFQFGQPFQTSASDSFSAPPSNLQHDRDSFASSSYKEYNNGHRSYGYSSAMPEPSQVQSQSQSQQQRYHIPSSPSPQSTPVSAPVPAHEHEHVAEPYPYSNQHSSLATKIMVGGIATLIGSNFTSDIPSTGSSNFNSLNAAPLLLFSTLMKCVQMFTLLSCVYYFTEPCVRYVYELRKDSESKETSKAKNFTNVKNKVNTMSKSKSKSRTTISSFVTSYIVGAFYYALTPASATMSSHESNPFVDITAIPTTFICLLITYAKSFYVLDGSNTTTDTASHLPNPAEQLFNKIVFLELMIHKSPLLGYLLGFEGRVDTHIQSLLKISQTQSQSEQPSHLHLHSHVINFIKLDPTFTSSPLVLQRLSKILTSLAITKSSQRTAESLYGINSDERATGVGYNTMYEYLANTPTSKINLFELVVVLWCVENLRAKMVDFLNDVVSGQEEVPDKDDIAELIKLIEQIESFIPAPCIKLIKCCKIFRAILDPTDEARLNDALKMILLSVEENLTACSLKDSEKRHLHTRQQLLSVLHSPIPTLSKVLKVVKLAQVSASNDGTNTPLISDENRLSLLCSIILHQYACGRHNYGHSLIKYLKREGSRKFLCSNSISLMALIATFKTLVVVLKNERIEQDIGSLREVDVFNILDDDDQNDQDDSDEEEEDDDEENDVGFFNDSEDFANDADVDDFSYNTRRNLPLLLPSTTKNSLSLGDHHILEDLLCGLRLYVGQRAGGVSGDETVNYDILSLHYGLQSELSHRLLELAKELAGYSE